MHSFWSKESVFFPFNSTYLKTGKEYEESEMDYWLSSNEVMKFMINTIYLIILQFTT